MKPALMAVVAISLIAACARPARLYDGPPRDPAEVALIERGPNTRVEFIDDVKVRGWSWEVEPGPHRILIVGIDSDGITGGSGFFRIEYRCWVDLEAAPGGHYEASALVYEDGTGIRVVGILDRSAGEFRLCPQKPDVPPIPKPPPGLSVPLPQMEQPPFERPPPVDVPVDLAPPE